LKIEIINQVFLRICRTPNSKIDVWLIHGFGESGLSFREAFDSKLSDSFNLFVPDIPGFGASPMQPGLTSLQDSTDCLEKLINETSKGKQIYIVAHSLGGVIGTWICQRLGPQVQKFVSIEGNMTTADAFFSGLAKDFDEPSDFHSLLIEKVISRLGNDESMHRYYASIRFSNPESLWNWGKTGAEATGEIKAGEEFNGLTCNKIYLWGDKSTPEQTKQFLAKNKVPNYCFLGSGHWPMIDATQDFYEKICNWLMKSE